MKNFRSKLLSAGAALLFSAGASYALFTSSVDRLQGTTQSQPVLTSCGTGAIAVGSSDMAGELTATGATGCIMTFGTPFATAPSCATNDETLQSRAYTAAVTATAITWAAMTSGDKVAWICIAKAGG